QVANLVEIDALGVLPHAVGDDRIELPGVIDGASGGQVPAVREIGAEHGVAGLQQGEVDGNVRLRARVPLEVGVLGCEQLLGLGDRELLADVHDLYAAV